MAKTKHSAKKLSVGHYLYRGFHIIGGGVGWRVNGNAILNGDYQTGRKTEILTDSCLVTSLKDAKRDVDARYEF